MTIYPNLIDAPTGQEDHAVLTVSLCALSKALENHSSWAATPAERSAETFMANRYHRVIDEIGAGIQLEMPWIYIERGELAVMDGRHRLYAMIDLGYIDVKVRVDQKDKSEVANRISSAGTVY